MLVTYLPPLLVGSYAPETDQSGTSPVVRYISSGFLASPVVIRLGLYTMQMNYLLNETQESFLDFRSRLLGPGYI